MYSDDRALERIGPPLPFMLTAALGIDVGTVWTTRRSLGQRPREWSRPDRSGPVGLMFRRSETVAAADSTGPHRSASGRPGPVAGRSAGRLGTEAPRMHASAGPRGQCTAEPGGVGPSCLGHLRPDRSVAAGRRQPLAEGHDELRVGAASRAHLVGDRRLRRVASAPRCLCTAIRAPSSPTLRRCGHRRHLSGAPPRDGAVPPRRCARVLHCRRAGDRRGPFSGMVGRWRRLPRRCVRAGRSLLCGPSM